MVGRVLSTRARGGRVPGRPRSDSVAGVSTPVPGPRETGPDVDAMRVAFDELLEESASSARPVHETTSLDDSSVDTTAVDTTVADADASADDGADQPDPDPEDPPIEGLESTVHDHQVEALDAAHTLLADALGSLDAGRRGAGAR